MTKKQELLQKLDIVKKEHIRWTTYAEAKFKGLEVDEDLTPIKHTECACGKMIAENGQIIYHLKFTHSLVKDHEEFHNLGMKLYELMNKKIEGNIFTKRMIKQKNNEMINNYAKVLKKLSDNLLDSYNLIAKEIQEMPEEKINNIFPNIK